MRLSMQWLEEIMEELLPFDRIQMRAVGLVDDLSLTVKLELFPVLAD